LRLRHHSRPVKSKCARKSYWGNGRPDTCQHQLEFFDWIGKQANQPGIRSVTRYKHPCWTRSKDKIITNMIHRITYPSSLLLSFGHEKRASNKEAHCLARSVVLEDPGRRLWLVSSPEGLCIPEFVQVWIKADYPQQKKAVFFTWPKLQEKMWLPNPESYVRVVVRFVCVIHPGNRVRCYLSLPKLGSVSRMILSDVASIYVIIHHHHCRYDKLASYVWKPWQWVRQ
jgi:hypothetical protein